MYRILATRLVMTIVIGVLVGLVAHSQTGAPKPCSAPEYRQFDFSIGDWRVEGPDGKLAGSNRIEQIAGGCGLQETWTAATGGGTGRSLNGYAIDDGKWHQVWIGSGGRDRCVDLSTVVHSGSGDARYTRRSSDGCENVAAQVCRVRPGDHDRGCVEGRGSESLLLMAFFVPLLVGLRHTSLKGRSGAAQAIFIVGMIVALAVLSLTATWLSVHL